MNFGQAIEALKSGDCVARMAWNGKNMHLYIQTFHEYQPCICVVTPSGAHQPGWTPSQADMLAEDWYLEEDADV